MLEPRRIRKSFSSTIALSGHREIVLGFQGECMGSILSEGLMKQERNSSNRHQLTACAAPFGLSAWHAAKDSQAQQLPQTSASATRVRGVCASSDFAGMPRVQRPQSTPVFGSRPIVWLTSSSRKVRPHDPYQLTAKLTEVPVSDRSTITRLLVCFCINACQSPKASSISFRY